MSAPGTVGDAAGRRWLTLVFVALAQFVIAIDVTVANVALPSIQAAIGLSDTDRQWVIGAYSLVFAGFLLSGGRISDRVGHRRMFVVGLVSFALASLVAGFAHQPGQLFAARVWQGLSGAVTSPSALALVSKTFPEGSARTKAMGIYSAVAGSGLALGLVLGGLLTELLGWRWAFWVSVPCAAVAALGVVVMLPRDRRDARPLSLDPTGSVLYLVALAAVALGVSRLQSGGLGVVAVGLLAAGVVATGALVVVERRAAAPVLPAVVVADRNRIGAYLVTVFAIMGLFGLFLLATFYLQQVKGYSPFQSGLAFVPLVVCMALGSTLLSGRYAHAYPRLLIVGGFALAVGAVVVMSGLGPDSSYVSRLLPAEILLGLGLGTILVPCTNISTYRVGPRQVAVAAAVFATVQQLGAAAGTIVLNGAAASTSSAWQAKHPEAGADQATIAGLVGALRLTTGLLVLGAVSALVLVRPTEPAGRAAPGPQAAALPGTSGPSTTCPATGRGHQEGS